MENTKKIDKIRAALTDEVFSVTELENIMAEFGYSPVEDDITDTNNDSPCLKFTNYASQIWIEPESIEEDCVIIGKKSKDGSRSSVNLVTKFEKKPSRVRVFQSYEDLTAVLDYFKNRGRYDDWLIGWLCTSLGRRVGDVISLKWSDLYKPDGSYQYRLETLKEEKTGKVVGALINALAQEKIQEYCELVNINPLIHYTDRIFIADNKDFDRAQKSKYEAFRKGLKEAAQAVGINYPIGAHSFRKWYANTLFKLHQRDANNLQRIKMILGHSSEETTAIYIEEIDRQIDKYNSDYAEYMLGVGNGQDMEINNSPIIAFKAEDFRALLSQCWDMAQSNNDKFDGLNTIQSIAEKLAVS